MYCYEIPYSNIPDLHLLSINIDNIENLSAIHQHAQWDSKDGILRIYWTRELTADEKIIIDGICGVLPGKENIY